mmetsp:Transcript_3451/g.14220  ORF Transcript_3451/g.14220 Transcript_3451/m.14220 type:complete len:212 (-) Transcript_3451:123-758(-)
MDTFATAPGDLEEGRALPEPRPRVSSTALDMAPTSPSPPSMLWRDVCASDNGRRKCGPAVRAVGPPAAPARRLEDSDPRLFLAGTAGKAQGDGCGGGGSGRGPEASSGPLGCPSAPLLPPAPRPGCSPSSALGSPWGAALTRGGSGAKNAGGGASWRRCSAAVLSATPLAGSRRAAAAAALGAGASRSAGPRRLSEEGGAAAARVPNAAAA